MTAARQALVVAGCLTAAVAMAAAVAMLMAANATPLATEPELRTAATKPRAAPPPPAPALELGAWSWSQRGEMWAETEGEVTNLTAEPLRAVQAHVSFYTADGTFITSDTALLDFNPVMPGQTSPFSVTTPWNPAMDSARVQFQQFGGPTIHHRVKGGAG